MNTGFFFKVKAPTFVNDGCIWTYLFASINNNIEIKHWSLSVLLTHSPIIYNFRFRSALDGESKIITHLETHILMTKVLVILAIELYQFYIDAVTQHTLVEIMIVDDSTSPLNFWSAKLRVANHSPLIQRRPG